MSRIDRRVKIRDVSPCDGFQSERPVQLEERVEAIARW